MVSYGCGEKKSNDILFDVLTPLGFHMRVSRAYWQVIVSIKHPEEIRRSKTDSSVYLFYVTQRKGRWVCAVSKKLNGEGFLITAYPTDVIKAGEKIWPK